MIWLFSLLVSSEMISVYYNATSKKFYHQLGKYDALAYARGIFNNNINTSGWADLHIESSSGYSDDIQAYTAGFAEGAINQDLFKLHRQNAYSNLCNGFIKCTNNAIPFEIVEFFKTNYQWALNDIQGPHPQDGFYFAASVFLKQLTGIVDGYNAVNPNDQITIEDLWLYNCRSEIFDVYRHLNTIPATTEPFVERRGTIFITSPNKYDDVVYGHTSWRSYGDSIKMSKRYRLRFRNNNNKILRKAISSYPFMIHSDDGMTITDQALVIGSTSIAIASDPVLKKINPQGYPHWFRELIASQLSHNGDEWATFYEQKPSGTCGVQHLILNMKNFMYKEDLLDHSVDLIDEIPGLITKDDVTNLTETRDYFGSYDVPYNKSVFVTAGYDTLVAMNPDLFSYEDSSRAKIIADKVPRIQNIKGSKDIIRYNDLTNEYQKKNAMLGISPREEINGTKCWGSIDAKITSVPRALHLHWYGISGPPNNGFGNFTFSKYKDKCAQTSHFGLPDDLSFDWIGHYFDLDI